MEQGAMLGIMVLHLCLHCSSASSTSSQGWITIASQTNTRCMCWSRSFSTDDGVLAIAVL